MIIFICKIAQFGSRHIKDLEDLCTEKQIHFASKMLDSFSDINIWTLQNIYVV